MYWGDSRSLRNPAVRGKYYNSSVSCCTAVMETTCSPPINCSPERRARTELSCYGIFSSCRDVLTQGHRMWWPSTGPDGGQETVSVSHSAPKG